MDGCFRHTVVGRKCSGTGIGSAPDFEPDRLDVGVGFELGGGHPNEKDVGVGAERVGHAVDQRFLQVDVPGKGGRAHRVDDPIVVEDVFETILRRTQGDPDVAVESHLLEAVSLVLVGADGASERKAPNADASGREAEVVGSR